MKRKKNKMQIDFYEYMKKENKEINIFKGKEIEDDSDIYIPIYPFNDESKPIKLNLIINYGKKHYEFGNYFKDIRINCLNYFPCPKSIHISDLKFMKIKGVKNEIKYFTCQTHGQYFDSFCSCLKVYCSKCDICNKCEKKIYYFVDKLNWKQFNNNKKKIINIIKRLISEFFPEILKELIEEEFCPIEYENIFFKKINKLSNKDIDFDIVKQLKKLILDLNSLITSFLKIFNPYNYFNQNNALNLDFFNDEHFSDIFEDIYYREKSFKSVIYSTLKNYIKYEKYLLGYSYFEKEKILKEKQIDKIIRIEDTKFILVKTNNEIKIFNFFGKCIKKIYKSNIVDIIQISKYIFAYTERFQFHKVLRLGILYIDYNFDKPLNFYFKEKIYRIRKIKYIKEKKIFIGIFKNEINFYNIINIKTFKYELIKHYNSIEFISCNKFSRINLKYKKDGYLYLTYFNYNLELIIYDIKNFSIVKKIKFRYYDDYDYTLKIINDYFLMVIFRYGKVLNISLKTYQMVNYFDLSANLKYDNIKYIFFNKGIEKKIIIFDDINIKIFKINNHLDFIEENKNDEKYNLIKLEKFKNENYYLSCIKPLDNKGKYIIGYTKKYSFFEYKYYLREKLKIINI